MSQAKSGDTVKIHYTGTLDDGTEFDSSAGRNPLARQALTFAIELVEIA